MHLPFWLAVTLLEHGEWLTGQRRPDDAESPLNEARELFGSLRATPWLDRLDRALPGEPALARRGALGGPGLMDDGHGVGVGAQ